MTVQDLRVPPHSKDAELEVLGAILINSAALDTVREILDAQDFYLGIHQAIFQAMCRLSDANKPVDFVTVGDALEESGDLATVGGRAGLAEIAQGVASAVNAASHARIVKEKAQARGLAKMAYSLLERVYDKEPVTGLLEEADRVLFQLSHGVTGKGFETIGPVLGRVLSQIEAANKTGLAVTGVPSGLTDLDRMTSGWQLTDLIIVAARPGMGKTSLAIGCAAAAARAGNPVGFISLEMSADQIGLRLLALESSLDVSSLRRGFFDQAAWCRLAKSTQALETLGIHVTDEPIRGMAHLRAKVRRLKAKYGLGLLIVDYLQLLHDKSFHVKARHEELELLSAAFKNLAKELRVPVMLLSQLNRECESRPDKRPMLSDLRGSGAIEQDADIVLCIYRDEVYNQDSSERGIAEILIRKHRNGPVGQLKVGFREQSAAFFDLANHEQ